MRSRAFQATMLFAAVFLAGCDSTNSGTPSAAPSSANTTSLPRAGAPKVANPLKTAPFQTDACKAATNAEVESVGGKLESAKAEDIAGGRGCAWIFADLAGSVSGALNVSEPDGLSHLYSAKAQGSGVTTFKPQPDIEGYPALVFANGGEGDGVCNLAVGVRDDVMYTLVTQIFENNPSFKDPCGLSVKVATFAIKHLKEAQQ